MKKKQDTNGSFTVPQIMRLLAVTKSTAYKISETPALNRKAVAGKYRIPKADFWNWYNAQNQYCIQDGEFDPDDYFTAKDVAEMFGYTRDSAVNMIKRLGLRSNVSTTKVLVKKTVFIDWYIHQFRYSSADPRLPSKEINPTYSINDIKAILGISANSTIYHLYHKGYFNVIRIGSETRVIKASFDKWYAKQTKYKKEADDGIDNKA